MKNWMGMAVCLVLGAVLFGSGYWLGQRSALPMRGAPAANFARSSPFNSANGARPGPMMPTLTGTMAPPNASPEMKEFMANRVTLMEKMAKLRRQNPNGGMNPEMAAQFQKENAALLQRQRELSQIIGQQQAQNPPAMPPSLQIPPNASPQQTAYLKARDQLMRDQIAFMNQHRNDDPATRQAAMQQWRQQNAGRFQELQKEAQTASQQNAGASPAQTPTPAPVKATGT